jgi:hypothetical protein
MMANQDSQERRVSGLHSRYRMFDEFNESDQAKLFQAMGLMGFFRRKNLPDIGFDSASVLLLIAQRQSENKETTLLQWQKILGMKAEQATAVCEELGFPAPPTGRKKQGIISLNAGCTTANQLFTLTQRADDMAISLTTQGKQLVEELLRLSIFKD